MKVSPKVGTRMVPVPFFTVLGTSFGFENVHIEGAKVCSHVGLITVTARGRAILSCDKRQGHQEELTFHPDLATTNNFLEDDIIGRRRME